MPVACGTLLFFLFLHGLSRVKELEWERIVHEGRGGGGYKPSGATETIFLRARECHLQSGVVRAVGGLV